MKEYYVYILRCADSSYYVGVTNDLQRRLIEHQSDRNPKHYTFSRRPVELLYYELYTYINDAIQREKQLQGWSRAKKEALITGDKQLLKRLASGKNSNNASTSCHWQVSRMPGWHCVLLWAYSVVSFLVPPFGVMSTLTVWFLLVPLSMTTSHW